MENSKIVELLNEVLRLIVTKVEDNGLLSMTRNREESLERYKTEYDPPTMDVRLSTTAPCEDVHEDVCGWGCLEAYGEDEID
jgi:hypothetical protein